MFTATWFPTVLAKKLKIAKNVFKKIWFFTKFMAVWP